ncbi:MAG: hypothetical protein WCT31_05230 [Candidatus Micrarchaeia archaeon]
MKYLNVMIIGLLLLGLVSAASPTTFGLKLVGFETQNGVNKAIVEVYGNSKGVLPTNKLALTQNQLVYVSNPGISIKYVGMHSRTSAIVEIYKNGQLVKKNVLTVGKLTTFTLY